MDYDGFTDPGMIDRLQDLASCSLAETVFAGVDPTPFMPRDRDACSPFEIIGACVEALEAHERRMRTIMGVTRERFVAICVEEGFTEQEATTVWEGKDKHIGIGSMLDEEGVREAARATAPLVKWLRRGEQS